MSGNANPIFSRVGDIQGGDLLTTAAADYTGQSVNNIVVFEADATNGGYIQKIRLKAIGTNVASVARVYVNNGQSRLAASIAAVTGTPTGSGSTTGGSLSPNTSGFFAKIIAVDQYGGLTAASTETAAVTGVSSGSTGSIAWAWTAVTGAVSYRVYVGPVTGGQNSYFTTSTNSYTQTTSVGVRDNLANNIVSNNNKFIGEVSLPATTAAAAAGTVDIDYPLNIALPPGYRIIVGLGTTVAAGWQVTGIGGAY